MNGACSGGWSQEQEELASLARKQLFFVGGAPRSGTTWVTKILDLHPDISCRGEGLFQKHLADPLSNMVSQRAGVLEAKNLKLFGQGGGGYPLPGPEDAEFLFGTAVLLALRRQSQGRSCQAIGEKTPENVFLFPRLKQLFPRSKCIAIARDPRDVLTSAWHFFHGRIEGGDEIKAKFDFITMALPSLRQGARAIIDLEARYPLDMMTITYEQLRRDPEMVVPRLFRFLGVPDAHDVVADCVARASFASLSGGRQAGVEEQRAFFRKGVSGDWTTTLTPAMNELISRELGCMSGHFGWEM